MSGETPDLAQVQWWKDELGLADDPATLLRVIAAAQKRASDPGAPNPTTDRGTGVPGPHGRAEVLIPADLVESDPGIRCGEPVMRGTRVPAADVDGLLADGLPWSEVHEYFPSVPLPDSTVCTGRQCSCFTERTTATLEPAAAAVFEALCRFNSDYAHGYDNADEMAVLADEAARPAHYREAADALDRLAGRAPLEALPGIAYACNELSKMAAELLDSTANDMGDTDGSPNPRS